MTDRIPDRPARRWDLFCRVVDNFGDAGVCWRIARQLAAEHGARVRLWIDAPATLAALRPGARPGRDLDGVRVERWDDADPRLAAPAAAEVADVVVGAFACGLPEGYRAAMRARRPVWIDLEYLSAEGWVASHHGLPSPKPDGLVEHFFFPGFGDGTGGLPRERDLPARRDAFVADPAARAAFLGSIGAAHVADRPLASLFCYPDAPAVALLDALAADPAGWRVLVPHGVAPSVAGHPLAVPVPFVPQADYDRLLWCCALNAVRGEDSLVRALWARRPLLWHPYRQADDAHLPKLHAFVDAWTADAAPAPGAARAFAAIHDAWNRAPGAPPLEAAAAAWLAARPALAAASARASDAAAGREDLVARLVEFAERRL